MNSHNTNELRAALAAFTDIEQALARMLSRVDLAAWADLWGPARQEAHHNRRQMGARLTELCAERGMLKEQLAQAIGLRPTSFSRIMTGNRGLDVRELVAIAQTLEVEIYPLLWPGLEATPLSDPLVAPSEARGTAGSRIGELRAARDMSQKQLALEVGLDPSALSRIETGARGLDVQELIRIAQALDVDIRVFLLRDPKATHLDSNLRQVRELLERLLVVAEQGEP